eukprot:g813.t1
MRQTWRQSRARRLAVLQVMDQWLEERLWQEVLRSLRFWRSRAAAGALRRRGGIALKRFFDASCVRRWLSIWMSNAVWTVNVIDGDESAATDGLSVQLDQEGLRSLRFSPDGLFIAFLCGRRLGSVQTMQPKQVLWPTCKWSSKADFEVLGYFWLPGGPQDCNSDLALVSTQGIEIFRLNFEQKTCKSLKTFPTAVRICWLDPTASTVLLCTGTRTLQPFDFRRRNPKLPRFDLVLTRGQSIEPSDVALVTIYDSSYCIHADGLTGKVSLRNVTNLEQGTPEHDIGFQVLNSAYRRVIEELSQKSGTRQTTVSLQELEAQIIDQSVLSEKDMVTLVFHPHFTNSEGLEAPSESKDSFSLDTWHIPESLQKEETTCGQVGKTPYILSVVIAYLRSLLGLQILPHKILQCFVFDLCVYYRQEHLLQQLLHYHVLLDSPELAVRLKQLARGDMALRVREFSVVAEMLLFSGQYLDIVPFLVNQKDVDFKVKTLLEDLEKDQKANSEDPELMQHVLTEIRLWKQEADARLRTNALVAWRRVLRRERVAQRVSDQKQCQMVQSVLKLWANAWRAQRFHQLRWASKAWRGFLQELRRQQAGKCIRAQGRAYQARAALLRWNVAISLRRREVHLRQSLRVWHLGLILQRWQSLKAATALEVRRLQRSTLCSWHATAGRLITERRQRELKTLGTTGQGSGPTQWQKRQQRRASGQCWKYWVQVVEQKKRQRRRLQEAKGEIHKLVITQALWLWHRRARDSAARADQIQRASTALVAVISASRWARAHDSLVHWIKCRATDLSGETLPNLSVSGPMPLETWDSPPCTFGARHSAKSRGGSHTSDLRMSDEVSADETVSVISIVTPPRMLCPKMKRWSKLAVLLRLSNSEALKALPLLQWSWSVWRTKRLRSQVHPLRWWWLMLATSKLRMCPSESFKTSPAMSSTLSLPIIHLAWRQESSGRLFQANIFATIKSPVRDV